LLTLEEGTSLVRLARRSIERYLIDGKIPEDRTSNPKLMRKSGVFVTLYKYPGKMLRGCIGFPYPVYPLWEATKRAAISAAVEDPRFYPLTLDELPDIIIEVSVLTTPERIDDLAENRSEIPKLIKIGIHGLIVKRGIFSGLLLPQVATEFGFNEEIFLDETCRKAGLEPGCWKSEDTEIYRFEAEIFEETKPLGEVIRIGN